MTLYVFITHQKNIKNCYDRIANMMVDDFVVVQGGFLKDEYDEEKKIINLKHLVLFLLENLRCTEHVQPYAFHKSKPPPKLNLFFCLTQGPTVSGKIPDLSKF